jgi:integrase
MITVASIFKPSARHRVYWIRFTDHRGVLRKLAGHRRRDRARRKADRVEALVDAIAGGERVPRELIPWLQALPTPEAQKLVSWGLVDRRLIAKGKPLLTPIDPKRAEEGPQTQLETWTDAMVAEGRSRRYADEQGGYVRRLLEAIEVNWPDELVPERIYDQLATWRKPKAKDRPGMSDAGCNHYLQAIKQFARWMERTGRIDRSPLAGMKQIRTKRPEVRQRRPMTVAEFQKLNQALLDLGAAGGRYKHQRARWLAEDRRMLYLTAVATAFRLNELRQLRVEDLRLDLEPASVVLKPEYSKNGQGGEVPIPADVADALRGYTATKLPAAPVFTIPTSAYSVPTMFRRDLEQADVEAETGQGRLDFHALRHTAITWWLDEYELNPKKVQVLARLSSLALVMNYSRRFRLDDTTWLGQAPDLQGKPLRKESA